MSLPKVCLPARLATVAEIDEAARLAVTERFENAPNWRMLSDLSAKIPAPTAAVMLTNALWAQEREITVSLINVASSAGDQIREELEELYSYTNLKLLWLASGASDAEIRITNTPGIGSWSYIGSQALQVRSGATMNLGWLEDGVVYHEGGHSLGMGHGHKNPQIPWLWDTEAVYRDLTGPPNNWTRAQVKHNVLDRYSAEEVSASSPDYDSIMAYAVPNEWTVGDYEVAPNDQLSERDIEWLRKTYPQEEPPLPADCGGKPSLSEAMKKYWRRRMRWKQCMKGRV